MYRWPQARRLGCQGCGGKVKGRIPFGISSRPSPERRRHPRTAAPKDGGTRAPFALGHPSAGTALPASLGAAVRAVTGCLRKAWVGREGGQPSLRRARPGPARPFPPEQRDVSSGRRVTVPPADSRLQPAASAGEETASYFNNRGVFDGARRENTPPAGRGLATFPPAPRRQAIARRDTSPRVVVRPGALGVPCEERTAWVVV